MAIRIKHGEKLSHDSLRVDNDCLFDGEVVKVWAKIQGQEEEKLYWLSDLVGDEEGEVKRVLKANFKPRKTRTAKSHGFFRFG